MTSAKITKTRQVSTREVVSPATKAMIPILLWIGSNAELSFVAIRIAAEFGATDKTLRRLFDEAVEDAPDEVKQALEEAWPLYLAESEEEGQ